MRFQVVDVLQRIARRILRLCQQLVELAFAEFAAIDQLEVVDIDAFLVDRGCNRRHRARCDTADIGVMTARGDPEQDFPARGVEHRHADREIGNMRAAVVRRVDQIGVAGLYPPLVLADDGFDGAIHRAEMHRHVRRVGNQRADRIEHGTGEIQPLLDVHRIGGVLQRHAHLLGDRHEQIVEHFEHHRVGLGADRQCALELLHPAQHQVILRRQFGLPAMLDDDGLMRLDDDRGTFDLVAGRKRIAGIDHRAVPFAAGEEARPSRRRRQLATRGLVRPLVEFRAAADRFDRHGLDHELLGRDRQS